MESNSVLFTMRKLLMFKSTRELTNIPILLKLWSLRLIFHHCLGIYINRAQLEKWLESKECGFEFCKDPSKTSTLFASVVKHYVTKHTTRKQVSEAVSKQILLEVDNDPSPSDRLFFNEFRDEVEEKIKKMRKIDKAHNFNYTKGVNVLKWDLVASAKHVVAYGVQHFAKIDIGEDKCVHIRFNSLTRAHAFLNSKPAEFHSIDTGRETMIHATESPLVYFDY